jgi:hypothetical protein
VEARLHPKTGKETEFVGRAQGSTKKTAEQDAARQLLTFLASRSKAGEPKATAGTLDAAESPLLAEDARNGAEVHQTQVQQTEVHRTEVRQTDK